MLRRTTSSRKATYNTTRNTLTLALPEEFMALCASDERSMAMEYYQRVGYPLWNKP